MKKQKIVMVGLLVLSLGLTGCKKAAKITSGKRTAETTTVSKSQEKEPVAETSSAQALGTPSENSQEYAVLLKNQTGQEITSFVMSEMQGNNCSRDFLADSADFKNTETRNFYFQPELVALTETATTAEDAPLINLGYNALVTFAGNSEEQIIHAFPFQDAQEVTLLFADDTLYVVYTSLETGESVSTLEYEKNQKELEASLQ